MEVVWFAIAVIWWYYLDTNSPKTKRRRQMSVPVQKTKTIDNTESKPESKKKETNKEMNQEMNKEGNQSTKGKEDYNTKLNKMQKAVKESERETTDRMNKEIDVEIVIIILVI